MPKGLDTAGYLSRRLAETTTHVLAKLGLCSYTSKHGTWVLGTGQGLTQGQPHKMRDVEIGFLTDPCQTCRCAVEFTNMNTLEGFRTLLFLLLCFLLQIHQDVRQMESEMLMKANTQVLVLRPQDFQKICLKESDLDVGLCNVLED